MEKSFLFFGPKWDLKPGYCVPCPWGSNLVPVVALPGPDRFNSCLHLKNKNCVFIFFFPSGLYSFIRGFKQELDKESCWSSCKRSLVTLLSHSCLSYSLPICLFQKIISLMHDDWKWHGVNFVFLELFTLYFSTFQLLPLLHRYSHAMPIYECW